VLSFRSLVPAAVLSLPLILTARQSKTSVDALIEAGHWKRVRSIAEAELRSDPNDAQAHFWLAKVLPGFNDFDSALAHAEKAVALDGNNAAYHGQLAEVSALIADRSTPLKGFVYVRRMRKEIDAALAIDPKHVDSLLVDMMFSFKAPAVAGGDKKKAFRIADRIQSISPEWGHLAHARLMQDENDDAGTEQVLLKAVHAAPNFYRAQAALAKFYCCTAQHKRPDLAEKTANEAIALDPNAAPAYAILARLYAEGQRWADLDKVLQKAEQAVPDDLSPYYEAAQACFNIGKDFARAQQYLSHYLGQPPEGREPTHAQARSLLARMTEKDGRKIQAFRVDSPSE
jgi:tetratricopeptide (TPR) repeat protein